MLRRLVQVVLILLAALSALAAVEVPVSDLTFETAPRSKRLPVLAAGDGGYLAVWLDERSGNRNLLATRIAATGEPLDPLGIQLGRAEFTRPQVLWNGESYLIFWNAAGNSALMVTRVTREGVAEAPRVLQEHARLDQRARAVATNGTHIVLAYNKGSGNAMHVAVMTRDAVLIEERVVDARRSFWPTVLANGGDFLVAWNAEGAGELYDFMAQRLDFRGAAIDAAPRRIRQGFGADILRNGNNYVAFGPTSGAYEPGHVSWSVSRDLAQIGESAPLALRHYDRAPSLLDGAPAMMVVVDATNDGTSIAAVTFDANGHEAGPRKRILELVPSHFAASRGNDALAMIEVKLDASYYADTLIGSIFDDDTLARKAPDRSLALSAREQRNTAIAGGGGRYLAVWEAPEGLTGGRFLPNGTRLDENGFALDLQASSPAVVFDGQRFVVSYVRNRNNANETIVRFVSPQDGLLPGEVLVDRSAYGSTPPSLAVGDGVVLVTWMNYDGVQAAALRGAQLIAPPRQIAESQGSAPAAAWNGRRFLVVWDEEEYDWDVQIAVRLQSMRLESDLSPVDAQPRVLLEHRTGQKEAVLSPWKGGWLIAFQDGDDIRLHEIGESGAMAATPFASVPGRSPRLVNTGSRPWLAWTSPGGDELRAASVRPDGTLGTEGALSVIAPPFGSSFGYSSAISALGADIAVAYSRVALEAGMVRRVFVSMVDNPTLKKRRAVR